jgi:osmoprotectant transport system ATP-binding protein
LQGEFKGIQQELGLTVMLVTHDMAEAMLLADRIAVMNEGQILREGTAAELLQDPGHDYVAALLATPRRHGELVRAIEAGARAEADAAGRATGDNADV